MTLKTIRIILLFLIGLILPHNEGNSQELVLDSKLPDDVAIALRDSYNQLKNSLIDYQFDSVKAKVVEDQIMIIIFCKWDSTTWLNKIEAYSGITAMYSKMNYKYFSILTPLEMQKTLHLWVYSAFARTGNNYLRDALKVVSFSNGTNQIAFLSNTKDIYFKYKNVEYLFTNKNINPAFVVVDKLYNLDGSKTNGYFLSEMLGLL